jgi:hypothetical protein
VGWIAEREQFERTTKPSVIVAMPDDDCTLFGQCRSQIAISPQPIMTLLPTAPTVNNEATSVSTGLYFQDNFKPVPSLSIGLGVRFDREKMDSSGYSFFDPEAESRTFDRLIALAGGEIGRDDFQQGNNDGLNNFGILRDPIFVAATVGAPLASAYITDPMRVAAIGRLTRHHSDTKFQSDRLAAQFPDIFDGPNLNTQRLRDLGVSTQQPENFTITNNNLAPRLSISWDPWQDGRSKLFGTWGRYYDRLFLNTVVGEEGPDYLARRYVFDPDGVTVTPPDPSANALATYPQTLTPNHHVGHFISRAAPSTTQVDRGLRTPFSDEWTLGFQREISPEVAFSVTYINRRYRD